ncbi:hypothetical protein AVEN_231039-1 [Araneus ventricosus]|uniref:Uncharacterized protein n=1 Tax=Araneus ventricosus TaxID=182803 RepID=A0A4Y2A389_ARAVE|nr:hypothetical protein AVEN_231039-1 [Araneus ventricosus]
MDDNAKQHLIVAVNELLEGEDIAPIDWPMCFSDLNLIESMLDPLGRGPLYVLIHWRVSGGESGGGEGTTVPSTFPGKIIFFFYFSSSKLGIGKSNSGKLNRQSTPMKLNK